MHDTSTHTHAAVFTFTRVVVKQRFRMSFSAFSALLEELQWLPVDRHIMV